MSKYKHALQVPTNAVHSYWASSVRACPVTLLGASELLVSCASPLRRGRRVAPFLWWGASGGSPAHARGHRVQVPVVVAVVAGNSWRVGSAPLWPRGDAVAYPGVPTPEAAYDVTAAAPAWPACP